MSSPPISDAESAVMQVLWRRSPQDVEEVVAELAGAHGWQPSTVKTLLNRLLNKGAVSAEKSGRRYLYTPVLAREDWVHAQSMGLLDRVFDGRLSPLVSHFARHRKLRKDDLEALRRLLEAHDRG